MIQVLLVDDHALVREGLRRLLEDHTDIAVIGEASGGYEALRMVRQLRPDVAVLDLSMPDMDGMEATKQIVSEGLLTNVLILTMHINEEYAARLLRAGAKGFVGKGALSEEVVDAIRKVASGDCYLPAPFLERLPKRYMRQGTTVATVEELSDREMQVLRHLGEGRTSREIAQILNLSAKTVDTYRARLLSKLGLERTADLIRFALRHGVVADVW